MELSANQSLMLHREAIVLSMVREQWGRREPDEFRRLVAVSAELADQLEPIIGPIIVLRPRIDGSAWFGGSETQPFTASLPPGTLQPEQLCLWHSVTHERITHVRLFALLRPM